MANTNSQSYESGNQNEFDLSQYLVDEETGFMLKNPLKSLLPYFEPWNELASSLPAMVQEKTFRDAVDKLPLLDHTKLVGHYQLRLAHLQLSFITTGYIWQSGDKGAVKVLPRCVALPYFKISELLGIKAILSHVDLALANWSLIDPVGPYSLEYFADTSFVRELRSHIVHQKNNPTFSCPCLGFGGIVEITFARNLECLYHLPGGKPGDWFCMVTFMVELSFAKCLKPIARIVNLLRSSEKLEAEVEVKGEIAKCLQDVTKAMKNMQTTLARMRENLDAKLFFNELRPFLGGWGGEGNPLPDGLIYEGVSDTPVKLTGGSAAQSSTLQVLDALLGVKHTQDRRAFLIRMRDYMPPDHKRLIEDLELLPHTLRDFVLSSAHVTLKSCYNQSLSALVDLRDYHIKIVKMYVILPSQSSNEGNYESLDKKGTGGTSLIPFLKDIWSDTKEKLLLENQQSATVEVKDYNNSGSEMISVFIVALAFVFIVFNSRPSS